MSAENVAYLPAPSNSTMVMVCGKDEFLETVSGDTQQAPPLLGKLKGRKIEDWGAE
jgi:hypothetical protein